MTCSRCRGLMVEDQLFDAEGTQGHMWTASMRCMNCGYIHDAMTVKNRRSQQVNARLVSSSEPDYLDEEVHLGAESFLRVAV